MGSELERHCRPITGVLGSATVGGSGWATYNIQSKLCLFGPSTTKISRARKSRIARTAIRKLRTGFVKPWRLQWIDRPQDGLRANSESP
jgi:hypothetical protein